MLTFHSVGAIIAQTRSSDAGISFLSWIILGLIAGLIASKMVNRRGEGVMLDIILGIIGAVVGGWLFRALGMHGVTGFNIWSLIVAIIGAVVLLLIWHAIRGDFRGRPVP
ncbi:MAG: GlsB/YeaQ/YmgE family stress response rane protein [Phycisphaerales bacterium]|jgi:uncharacterized membrane protein YeaQ/YmgE (transglycosylase-associated protein family)|nr:GlsB/YeaQ/YmgE family stress response rane protein [Phycisphaerales bacterium]MDB5301254.1 GlsB/YeaQ/YmgE family stress response rane protein [Phycisphaerales bacterium]MDB5303269.1 GlsB/YeaQ/YmgE family stress response rane protein [Phycisphaerales bacterium]